MLDASDRTGGHQALLEWVTGIGEPEPCAPCAQEVGDAYLRPELEWIADEQRLGEGLSSYLRRVHRDRSSAAAQHYVSFVAGVGNPVFEHEEAYPQFARLDAGYRLLALFRFWNVIEYWFPYRDLIPEEWDGVLSEFVPRFVAARGAEEYRLELIALIARVHDSHANLWGPALALRPPRGEHLLAVSLRFVEGRAIVAALTGTPPGVGAEALRVGDVLLALDGRPVDQFVEACAPLYAASNEPARLRDIAAELTRGEPGPLAVQVERADQGGGVQTLELRVERRPAADVYPELGCPHDLAGPTFRLLSPEVAYLKLSSVRAADVADHVRAAQGTRGMVIDIRNYPSEFAVFALGQLFVREPTPFARFTTGVSENPGAFQWTEPLVLRPAEPHYGGRVVILVDEVSQSQSEYTCMAFRAAPDALVVGGTTAGADGNVSPLPLPGGLRTMISGIGVFYPDKTGTQRVGIVPDVEVRPTIAGLRAGRDEVLEEALRRILGPERPEAEIRDIARAAVGGG